MNVKLSKLPERQKTADSSMLRARNLGNEKRPLLKLPLKTRTRRAMTKMRAGTQLKRTSLTSNSMISRI